MYDGRTPCVLEAVDFSCSKQDRKCSQWLLRLNIAGRTTIVYRKMQRCSTSINIPLLVMYGNLDHACVVKSAQDIQRTVSRSSIWVAEGAAHLPNVEKPDSFNEQIIKYIKQ